MVDKIQYHYFDQPCMPVCIPMWTYVTNQFDFIWLVILVMTILDLEVPDHV